MNLPTEYQQYIHLSRYARWLEDKGRRETWGETVERFMDFITKHLAENFDSPVTQKDLKRIHEAILNLAIAMGYTVPPNLNGELFQLFKGLYQGDLKRAKKFSRMQRRSTGFIRPQEF